MGGALPLLLACLRGTEGTCGAATDMPALASEASEVLWLLLDDSQRCSDFCAQGGNALLLRISQSSGVVKPSMARTLSSSLYTEPRRSALWGEGAWAVLPPSLREALVEERDAE